MEKQNKTMNNNKTLKKVKTKLKITEIRYLLSMLQWVNFLNRERAFK